MRLLKEFPSFGFHVSVFFSLSRSLLKYPFVRFLSSDSIDRPYRFQKYGSEDETRSQHCEESALYSAHRSMRRCNSGQSKFCLFVYLFKLLRARHWSMLFRLPTRQNIILMWLQKHGQKPISKEHCLLFNELINPTTGMVVLLLITYSDTLKEESESNTTKLEHMEAV